VTAVGSEAAQARVIELGHDDDAGRWMQAQDLLGGGEATHGAEAQIHGDHIGCVRCTQLEGVLAAGALANLGGDAAHQFVNQAAHACMVLDDEQLHEVTCSGGRRQPPVG
jgi:hypothetical protein